MGRKWDKKIFERYHVVASPSQMVDYLDCPRKWWFRRVCRLPVIEGQEKFVFGNVLHAVIQRWLLADERGRDPNGQPVDIYPTGWEQDKGDDGKVNGTVNKREAQLIQMLVKNAADSGLLRRTPGRKIEREFELEIVPGVGYIGALDVDEPEGVEDHKSTKARKWISSEKDLANDPKMLSYAEIWRREHPESDVVKLRLNYMVKDPEDLFTKPVEVLIPTPDVERFWNETIMPAAEGMLKLKFGNVPVADWSKITGPQNPGVCKKYGGCTFAAICARMKTPTVYSEEINRANGKLPPIPETPPTPKPAKTPMGIFKKSPMAAPKSAPPPAPPAVAETVELVPSSAPAKAAPAPAPAPAAVEVPPWAVKGCVPCKGAGLIVSKGRACKACDSVQAQRGGPQSSGFDIQFNPDGSVSWSLKAGSEQPQVPTPPPPPKPQPAQPQAAPAASGSVQVTAPAKAAKTKTKPPAVKAPEPAPAPEPVVAVASDEPMPAVEPDVQREGFRLFINSLPMGGEYVDLAHVLADEGAELAREKGAESFYALDSFKRRDMLVSVIGAVVREKLNGRDVVAIGGSQDLKAYAEALRPLANEVIIGVF